jgi:MFS family permease
MVFLGAALTLISYGAVDFAAEDLTAGNLASVVAGLIALVLFFAFEMKASRPLMDFSALGSQILRYSILAAFFLSLGYLAVVFLITMYLQGIRALSPLYAALLLIPGYVAGSFLSPVMGRLSDRYGARWIATCGAGVIILATLLYLSLRIDTPLWFVLVASGVSGIGTSMFFPANNAAVMAHAPHGTYGGVSGLLRAMQNIGILGSFVITIAVAAASVPRQVAFEVFIGTTNLKGGVSQAFIQGIDAALWISLVLIAIAGVLSWLRGEETRGPAP